MITRREALIGASSMALVAATKVLPVATGQIVPVSTPDPYWSSVVGQFNIYRGGDLSNLTYLGRYDIADGEYRKLDSTVNPA